MPGSYLIDESRGLVFSRGWGVLTDEELQADPEQFRVFRAIGPALEWVGLDSSMPWPADEPHAFIGATR